LRLDRSVEEDSPKTASFEVFECRDGLRVAKQALRRHHNQRLAPAAQHLAPEYMEVLGRCRRVYNLDIVVDGKLQEALQTRTRMLRSLSFEPMGKEKHEPAQPAPLLFGADKELVDDDLSRIDEVSKLALPKNQPVGAVQAVPILETQHTRLGEGTVVKLHRRLIRCEMLKRHIHPAILDIVQDGVPLAKGSTRRVLAR